MKVALFKNVSGSFETVYDVDTFTHLTGYVQVSETVEIDFVSLPADDIITPQVDYINERIKAVKAEYDVDIMNLEDQKAELLALPNPMEEL